MRAGLQNFLKTVREHAPLLESSEYLDKYSKHNCFYAHLKIQAEVTAYYHLFW